MAVAHLNRIATVVPEHDVHASFVRFASRSFECARERSVFERLVKRASIEHRFSVLGPIEEGAGSAARGDFYVRGRFPSTGERMRVFETEAPELAARSVDGLGLGDEVRSVTHVIVTSCTGLYAPGIDLQLIHRFGIRPSAERTMVGFMGCYAAINALKLARHIVRSAPDARVLLVNVELCSLHLRETSSLEEWLAFLLFGDGAAASVVSAEPTGLALDSFHALLMPDTSELITWKTRDAGFEMVLSGRVPLAVERGLSAGATAILGEHAARDIAHWAVHPGGRSVLDAVERGLGLGGDALDTSREVLRRFGNMSSATIMFVLASMLGSVRSGQRGCAMSFGPGLTAETMLFHGA